MAYGDNELVSDGDSNEATPRVIPDEVVPRTVAAGTGTLPVLTPMAYHTGLAKWVPWTAGGSSGETDIKAFVYPDACVLDPTGDVICQMLYRGKLHLDDIEIPDGETLADLKTALQSGMRAKGISIDGLEKQR